jgi:hypothetical protein
MPSCLSQRLSILKYSASYPPTSPHLVTPLVKSSQSQLTSSFVLISLAPHHAILISSSGVGCRGQSWRGSAGGGHMEQLGGLLDLPYRD